MTEQFYLVLMETSGNQAFIFSTNKLRENVGASEVTYRVCSQWVLEAVTQITQNQLENTESKLWDEDSERLRENLLNPKLNPPIEAESSRGIEVIIAVSGKALLITRELAQAQQIIEYVTLKALKEAPGLTVCGAIEAFTWNTSLPKASQALHKKFEVVRSLYPSPELRFLRLPIVEDCRTSGLPAAKLDDAPGQKPVARSQASLSKREWAEKALNHRLPILIKDQPFKFAKSTDRILDEGTEASWLAVIHADGNGLGQIFINLEQYINGDRPVASDHSDSSHSNRNYIEQFRAFSLALDVCTRKAFIAALNVFPADQDCLPLVPLILGGDDLTVVCDAKYALAFTQTFLEGFEQETRQSTIISHIASQAFKIETGQLSACAGIAIVKSHFPFFSAYQLAEDLTKSAKVVKEYVKQGDRVIPCSAIDYHILYDTRGTDLQSIRDRLTQDQAQTLLYNRPYVVSPIDSIQRQTPEQDSLHQWLEQHHWSKLERRVEQLLKKDKNDRRILPNSQMHHLRESLFIGREGANGQYELIRKRYAKQGIAQLAATDNDRSLFWQDGMIQKQVTGLLDAMDAADFWTDTADQEDGMQVNTQQEAIA
jgi:hypothetical protein